MTQKAFITGITGQDGGYLAQHLVSKGYEVHGLVRPMVGRIYSAHLLEAMNNGDVILHNGDLLDGLRVAQLVADIKPDHIYNLAAQTHVGESFMQPLLTANVNAIGVTHILEAIRLAGLMETVRLYQAGTSEMFGRVIDGHDTSLNENSLFKPCSPYAAAKLHAHYQVITYREAYGLFGVNGILFNHESPHRGAEFVTRKTTLAAARIKAGLQDFLALGNLDAKRDWGYARDYTVAMVMMLEADKALDLVIATGKSITVREMCSLAFEAAGLPLKWDGAGADERGICTKSGKVLVQIDPAFYRPLDIGHLRGDASLARENLGWKPETDFAMMIEEMVLSDQRLLDGSGAL
tara:strand:- start:205 stop:1254 length:1050 start_codon:yes stop_codon:yes gene_type:complete